MTKEIIDYTTKEEMKLGKTTFNAQGMRSLHTNFINNDESQGYRVTFVDGLDDPNNDPILVAKRITEEAKRDRDIILKQKAKNGILTPVESTELMKRLAELL